MPVPQFITRCRSKESSFAPLMMLLIDMMKTPSASFDKTQGMLETAASVGRKVKDAIVLFHGNGRLVVKI